MYLQIYEVIKLRVLPGTLLQSSFYKYKYSYEWTPTGKMLICSTSKTA